MKYPDFHTAIEENALIRSDSGVHIIKSELTGERAVWGFDFRTFLLTPQWLNRYAEIFWEEYANQYPFQVCGMETAGIPLVAAIVMKGVERGTPVNGFYFRKSRKRKDFMKQVEGVIEPTPVIIVDEILNTGGTVNKQVLMLKELGVSVAEIFCLVRFRDERTYEYISSQGVSVEALYSLEDFNIKLESEATTPLLSNTLEEAWRFKAKDPSFHIVVQKSAPALDETHVFFGTDSGVFYALRQDSGEVEWRFETKPNNQGKGILSSPLVSNGVVYFGAYDGTVYALDAKTGIQRWKYSDADWVGSSPALALDLGLIYIGLEFSLWRKRGGIVALDVHTGAEVWRANHPSLTHGSPLYIQKEKMVVIGSNDYTMYAYNAKSGTLLWTYQTMGDIKMAPAYDEGRKVVLAASMDGSLYAISAQNGKPVHVFKAEEGMYSTPLIDGDTVYIASLDKKLYAIDLDTFEPRWDFETAGRMFSSPVKASGSIWIGSNDGCLYEIDPHNGECKSFFQATERVVSKIAYNPKTELIFMCTVANELYCLRRKTQE